MPRREFLGTALIILAPVWVFVAVEGDSVWLAVAVSVLLLGTLTVVSRLVASKASDPPPRGLPATDRERRARQQAELGGSLAPRTMARALGQTPPKQED